MHYEYFRKANCPSCGSGIVIDLSICPYCQRELEFVWKLEPEEEVALSKYVDSLNHRLLSELPTFHWKIAYTIVSFYLQRWNETKLEKKDPSSVADPVRQFSYFLLFLKHFIFFLPVLSFCFFLLANLWGFLFISILSIFATYLLTHFQIEKDIYSHKKMVDVARAKIFPEIKSYLKNREIGWTDFDQFIVSKHMKTKNDVHSTIASIVYLDGRK